MPTITLQVSVGYDDAGAYWWKEVGVHIDWGLDAGNVSPGKIGDVHKHAGLIFRNVNIPQGAIINSAILKCRADWTCPATNVSWLINGEAVANAVEFSTLDELKARPRTVATVDSGDLIGWTEGEWYEIPNLEGIIQEIVNGAGWVAGNALALLITGTARCNTTHEITSYDRNPSQAPILEITYEGAGGYTLNVQSSPITEVTVTKDGVQVGVTPINLSNMEGNHIIEVPQTVER